MTIAIHHDFNARASDSDIQTGMAYANQFETIPTTQPYRPERKTPRPRIEGMQTAIVVGSSGDESSPDEIFTDAYARVRVRFHWMESGAAAGWLRVAHSAAGQGWGAITIPRQGQEVLVGFLDGDPDRPIVVGSLYNSEQLPPFQLPDGRTYSGYRSHTKNGGATDAHQLIFNDAAGSELIDLHSQGEMRVRFESNAYNHAAGSLQIRVGYAVDDVSTSSCGSGVGGASAASPELDIDVNGPYSIDVVGDVTEDFDQDRSTDIAGKDTLSIGGDCTTTVAGDQSLAVSGKRTTSVSGDDSTTVSGNRTASIAGNDTLAIQGTATWTVNGKLVSTVTEDSSDYTAGNFTSAIGGSYTFSVIGAQTAGVVGADTYVDVGAQTLLNLGSQSNTVLGVTLFSYVGLSATFFNSINNETYIADKIESVLGETVITVKKGETTASKTEAIGERAEATTTSDRAVGTDTTAATTIAATSTAISQVASVNLV